MSDTSAPVGRPGRRRPPVPRLAVVTGTRLIPGGMVRVTVEPSVAVSSMDLAFTDHYVKLLFPPAGASWSWEDADIDPGTLRETYPRDQWPVMRTYTLRSWDPEENTFDIDFVVHGDSGLAGPWAASVQPGAHIAFAGPGGAWRPSPEYTRFMLIGDEAAAPAIFAAVEALPVGSHAEVFLEEEDAAHRLEVPEAPTGASVTVHRVERNGAVHGTELVRAVVESGVVDGARASWFVHGVAEMIRDVRRHLFVDNGVDKSDVSVSGYWRLGMVEDEWQAGKRQFNEENEAEEAAQAGGSQATR